MARKRFSISPTGTISTQAGPFTVSGNPLASSGTANVGTQAGPNSYSLSAGFGPNPKNPSEFKYGVTPRVQLGQNQGAQMGATAGGMIGGAIGTELGGPWGGAAGSAVGSAAGSLLGGETQKGNPLATAYLGGMMFGPAGMVAGAVAPKAMKQFGIKTQSAVAGQKTARNSIRAYLQDKGVTDQNGQFALPDGTLATLNFEGDLGKHQWKNPNLRTDKEGNRPLFAYETDYTNDMDFVSNMAGNSLARMLGGGANKAIDQMGSALGNQFLGTVGYGADMTPDNFKTVMGNARSVYSRAGIQNKEEMLGLANKLFSDGRISDTDYATMQQTANVLFNDDYGTARALMGGRWNGIKTASQTPSGGTAVAQTQTQTQPQQTGAAPMGKRLTAGHYTASWKGVPLAPRITMQEAAMLAQPLIDQYYKYAGKSVADRGRVGNAWQLASQILGGVTTGTKAFSKLEDLWNVVKNKWLTTEEEGGFSLSGPTMPNVSIPGFEWEMGNGETLPGFEPTSPNQTGNSLGSSSSPFSTGNEPSLQFPSLEPRNVSPSRDLNEELWSAPSSPSRDLNEELWPAPSSSQNLNEELWPGSSSTSTEDSGDVGSWISFGSFF